MYLLYRSRKTKRNGEREPLSLVTGDGGKDPNKKTAKKSEPGFYVFFTSQATPVIYDTVEDRIRELCGRKSAT